MIHKKNHLGFISAASQVIVAIPSTHILMVGLDIDWHNAELTSAIKQTGYQQHFHMLGLRDDIPKLMNGLDVYTSSWGEAFPNVLGEAMACGTPVIATPALGGTKEILGDIPECIIVEDISADSIAKGIETWMGDDRQRISKNAISKYKMKKICHSMKHLFFDAKFDKKYK